MWRVRHARIELLGDPARALDLYADGLGHWTDAVTGAAPALDGCLERRPDGARWRFRSLDGDFTAELPVDRAGLVRDYPGIARRLR